MPSSTSGPEMDTDESRPTATPPTRVSRWAVLSCILYLSVAFSSGGVFPFSPFSMYAHIGSRVPARKGPTPKGAPREDIGPRAAIITAKVDGEFVRAENLERFSGLDAASLVPPRGWSSSMQYRIDEVLLWLHRNEMPPDEALGPLEVEIGFLLVEFSPDGIRSQRWKPVTQGHAWPRH